MCLLYYYTLLYVLKKLPSKAIQFVVIKHHRLINVYYRVYCGGRLYSRVELGSSPEFKVHHLLRLFIIFSLEERKNKSYFNVNSNSQKELILTLNTLCLVYHLMAARRPLSLPFVCRLLKFKLHYSYTLIKR